MKISEEYKVEYNSKYFFILGDHIEAREFICEKFTRNPAEKF